MFSDDLRDLHLFMTMLELIPRGTETIASITEQFGLKQGLPYRVPCRNAMASFCDRGFLYSSLLLLKIIPEKSCQVKGKQMVDYFD